MRNHILVSEDDNEEKFAWSVVIIVRCIKPDCAAFMVSGCILAVAIAR